MTQKITMIGGSLREGIAADILINKGYKPYLYGINKKQNRCDLEKCLKNTDILFLPVRSNYSDGKVMLAGGEKLKLTAKEFSILHKDAVVYGGAVSAQLKDEIQKADLILKEYMEEDEIAVPNADLTAEGTLAEMMAYSQKACSEWKVGILGAGRVGKACGNLFRKIGIKSVIFCRRIDDINEGRKIGLDMRYYSGLNAIGTQFDFLINTVPALIVTEEMTNNLSRNVVIIDLASAPGGVDFELAEKNGIKAFLLPGVPERYAPVSAGRILGDYYLKELQKAERGNHQ